MKRLFPYYDIAATLRWPARTKPWPEWPHVYFANMQIDEASLRAFQHNFGPFRESAIPVAAAKRLQDGLRAAWKAAAAGFVSVKLDPLHPGLGITVTRQGGVEIMAKDLWTFIYVALARDAVLGKAKICANPDCPNPYFLQSKRGQIFCSHPCAGLVAVRKFRERHAKKKGR